MSGTAKSSGNGPSESSGTGPSGDPMCPEISGAITITVSGGCLDGTSILLEHSGSVWQGEGPGSCGGWVGAVANCVDDGIGGIGLSYAIGLWESQAGLGVVDGAWALNGNMKINSEDPLDAEELNVAYLPQGGPAPDGCVCSDFDLASAVTATS
ncbi:MAG: hypothetical protein ACK5Q5_19015 [Planctomycetaceae bacterium]